MTTHSPADIQTMDPAFDYETNPGSRMPESAPHAPPARRTESAEARAARVAAIAKAVRNGTYDTEMRARLASDALFEALATGRRPGRR